MAKNGGRVALVQYGHRGAPRRCVGCRRPVVYGDRCPGCQAELRARRKRRQR